MSSGSYLRFPHIHRDLLAFVAEDDVWIAPLDGGRAWRLTIDRVRASHPRISPDGRHVAWTSWRDSDPEVHAAPVEGGPASRLTHWANYRTRMRGWADERTVVATAAHDQPFHFWTMAYTVPLAGGPGTRLPYGPVSDLHLDGGRALLLTGSASHDPAHWKRYRGGGTGRLWLDGKRVPLAAEGQLAAPMLVGDRLVFLSDHDGTGNLYSCAPDGSDLVRHTEHDDFYARQAATDGERVVYARAGELWLLPSLEEAPRRLEVTLGGAGRGRQPYPAHVHVRGLACDTTGRASAVEVAGTVHWLTHEDGPARALAVRPGVRARLPIVLGGHEAPEPAKSEPSQNGPSQNGKAEPAPETEEDEESEEKKKPGKRINGPAAWVSDAGGEDAIELAEPGGTVRTIAGGAIGRVVDMEGSPDGATIAVADHEGRLLLVRVETGEVTELTRTANGSISGMGFDPRSEWLVWCHPVDGDFSAIRMARLPEPGQEAAETVIVEVTDGRFTDTWPAFTADGRHLAFLSRRGFGAIYDAHSFDLAFPLGSRPYLLPLSAGAPSPFAPSVAGRPVESPNGDSPVEVDTDGLAGRIVALPVPEARYYGLRAVKGGLVWLRFQPGEGLSLERFDLDKRKCEELSDGVGGFSVSGDGAKIVVVDGHDVRVISATGKNGDSVSVDLSRIRVEVDPVRRWRQSYAEAGRIVRDHFWVEDMAGVDWPGVLERYRPWLDRIAGGDDFADLLAEAVGELGASHAYVFGRSRGSGRYVGMLGADLAPDTDGLWRVRRIYPAELSDPHARSPLQGTGVRPGDALLAVDGRPVDPRKGPAELLVDTADRAVELTVESGAETKRIAVVPVLDDVYLRYHAWVGERRTRVRELSEGRLGYLHVPDMGPSGWAQLHRDLSRELTMAALIVDVRGNRGGHTSQLVVEKLSRRIVGWNISRRYEPESYPRDAPRGPVVVLCDEETCSDGDVVTAAVQSLGLGPVVGARTWGGVIGIDRWHVLGDGTAMTVPGYAYWIERYGWELENRGATPDVEVLITPGDWARGSDPQLDTAVRLALEALAARPAGGPPDPATRPFRGR
ncbi:tricorn protease [Acrocarpospora phusangensis]|uniref:Tricorn protease homolog n=1 Tax=Acrocarpospora phusangensis TaxID=1070424 RepID=A0A919UNR6_9ACTN|nr:S41 family peptidase [Acrocarpospora phusangensis]GIH22940.1 tricorn protease [Acrocarpospora phusangensis]